ncbi:hypothetical protein [Mucilaginibacter sp.]|jgi:hypothetical protein|uniref:hypothetical protein n=1 Tax=Mucilaginibacter sp. TaxID=1882438 RepID=UPI00261F091B|nr:hypothetical protein [Mucilaginibacter sp.]MDB4926622.1 hypothetical protein [Mucilaginibacter sp.]
MQIVEFKGIQLQLTKDDPVEGPWIEAWYVLPNGHCVIEKFIVLETGKPSYQLIDEALVFWGQTVLSATLNSTQMSPELASRYLFTAIVQQHEKMRWN